MKEIVNIVICYENAEEVCLYAKELDNQKCADKLSLVVVVNKLEESKKYYLEDLRSKVSYQVYVEYANDNLGYMNGLLLGYKRFREKNLSVPDYIVLSNTDIKYSQNDFFCKLSEEQYEKNIWVIGPSVYSCKRRCYDNPTAYERRSRSEINRLIKLLSIPFVRVLYIWGSDVKARIMNKKKPPSAFTYEVHGCYFIVSGEFMEYLKDKRYGAFLYSEEAFIAEEAYKNNKRVYYNSFLEVYHEEHSVTSMLKTKKIANYIQSSMQMILREYY